MPVFAGEIVQAKTGIDLRQRKWDLLLLVVGAKSLESPAGDGDVAVGGDSFGFDDIAKPVVVGDVVSTGDGLVRRDPQRFRDAPHRVELPSAIAVEIAAE